MTYRFIDHRDPLLKPVKALWRKNASTLGFFPEDAFFDPAKKKWILIAEDNEELKGYVLFRIVSSNQLISITHLCIVEDSRGENMSIHLLDQLVNKYKPLSLRGIKLSCRQDYKVASKLWERYGFKPVNEKKGKNLDGHSLIHWWYDFENPNLFTGIAEGARVRAVIDVNIIIHLRDTPSDHNKEAHVLLADWVMSEVDFFYAPETFIEITRDKDSHRRQQTRNFLKNFKQLSENKYECDKIFKEICAIISGSSENDISDKRQLAETIISGIQYFITRDINLLSYDQIILEKFGVSVLKPNEFILQLDEFNNALAYQPIKLAGANYNIRAC